MLESLDPGTISAGKVLRLVRNGQANTRTELARLAGLSRSTLAERVQTLLALELLDEVTGVESTGGRPPATLAFNSSAGVVLVADIDGHRCRAAVSDLEGSPVVEQTFALGLAQPPAVALEALQARFVALLRAAGVGRGQLWGIGVGVPAPVAVGDGSPIAPGALPGWDGFSIPDWLAAHYDAPVLVDHHVNVAALGEHWTHWRDAEHLLYVTVGSWIGCGIVSEQRVHRGANGTAGDIGHVRVAGHRAVPCRCGNTGCLEAVAGGAALADRLRAAGLSARSSADVVHLPRAGEPLALQAIRDAGRAVGEVLAEFINFYNPSAVVIGGELAQAPQQLLAGVREAVIGRSLPMATRDLKVASARLGERAGMIGAAIMVIEDALAPANVDRVVARHAG
jgi:predicted NBD/HSP70 family sugar kinase